MQLIGTTRRLAFTALALVASLGFARRADAQGAGIIRGTVTDSASNRGIPGVQVNIVGTTRGAVTNDAGQYQIRGVTAGNAQLRAQRLGFMPIVRAISVRGGDSLTENFVLRALAVELGEIVSVGYGTSSRHEVTSAIASVDSSAISNVP